MKPHEFVRFFHPKLGRFVYKHKGSGIIFDNVLKPIKSIATQVLKKVVKPLSQTALTSGISHAGDKLRKKASEKSSDFIMKKLASRFNKSNTKNNNYKT